mmetsp:Transcript_20739/g.60329  ORF Transcript_20739/g.60329 Transcript_20739/m.60329 type:complete len:132 (+) Transcript_20739:903-1298(+)
MAALRRLVLALRRRRAASTTPLAAVKLGTAWKQVRSTEITSALRTAVTSLGDKVGFRAEDVSARSMRAGGAKALLLSKVDSDTIRLVGRWRSDVMLRYLHTMAKPFTQGLASQMVAHGEYTLMPPSNPQED